MTPAPPSRPPALPTRMRAGPGRGGGTTRRGGRRRRPREPRRPAPETGAGQSRPQLGLPGAARRLRRCSRRPAQAACRRSQLRPVHGEGQGPARRLRRSADRAARPRLPRRLGHLRRAGLQQVHRRRQCLGGLPGRLLLRHRHDRTGPTAQVAGCFAPAWRNPVGAYWACAVKEIVPSASPAPKTSPLPNGLANASLNALARLAPSETVALATVTVLAAGSAERLAPARERAPTGERPNFPG